ncbi:hypothetical protein EMPS_09858 [Entomortierella parvispora]|uniref:Uncharacterized protein n=1 Tax=Entomortierella parvispora TaxID=205924 RepID=A0A9P3M0N8_9FUNG|nr:hypothetical protein EMPS_09858 [Entomortierella parvispora]
MTVIGTWYSDVVINIPPCRRVAWRQDLRGLYAWPYLSSCARPEEFQYSSFLTWTKEENLGKAKARAEWRNAIAHMQRSNIQILKETARRLNKAWAKSLRKDLENSHFCNLITKRKLENDRHTLHQAVDSVLTKRSRLEYRVEEDILDSALSSENHDARDEIEQEEQEDPCEMDEREDHEVETDEGQLNKLELEDLRANLAEVTHNECDWKVGENCVACLFQLYQGDCIDALESGELRKMEIADAMALIGVFAPHIPTPRMLLVFGSALDDVVAPVRLPIPDINDSTIMAAVRVRRIS